MELKEEFQEAKTWVEENFHLNVVSQSPWGIRARSSWRGRGSTLSSLRPRVVEALAPGCQQSSPAMTLPSPPWGSRHVAHTQEDPSRAASVTTAIGEVTVEK